MAEGNFIQLERQVNKCTKGELEEWAGNLYEFIRSREEICTRHMVDFFIDDVWNKLPQKWRDSLLPQPLPDICKLAVQCTRTSVAQDSLEEFLLQAKSLCLAKQCRERSCSDSEHKRLASFAMTSKKSYEVQNMSCTITDMCRVNGIDQVLDFGSGKGYLSEYLSMTSGLQVVGIDAVVSNAEGAHRRNSKIQKIFKVAQNINQEDCVHDNTTTGVISNDVSAPSNPPKGAKQNYLPITKCVHVDNVDILLTEVEQLSGGLFMSAKDSMVIGLHTCGDLCSNLLRLFCSSDRIRGMCCVGCCYHHITEAGDTATFDTVGFPLSSYLQKHCCKLGRNARMLACQSLERQSTNIKQFEESMKSIFYRTVLQVILYHKFKVHNLRDCSIGKVFQKDQNFVEYTRQALRKLSLPDEQLTDSEINSYLSQYENDKKHLVAFHQLRAVMAPCIESLIALDRLMYLKEQPAVRTAWVECLFDPIKSPRCLTLLALK
ncbi:probable methyltransferase-like protein 25 isoform X2 [Dysidea avara]|uniref:probable methyltransferase-like protein 25 isoform X2 n=1 Tax=Dysidea avara TaxID=196820 RepID=UPI003319068C